ncbi:hypothetical protein [uncultured Mediterranean phage uvMED]|nr:hypothetical protein [uncultured Mediterranean phage uvMED]
MSEVQKYLDEFKRSVISEAKRNLRKQKHTGNLSKSLKSRVKESKNSIEITFKMNAYGFFQDRGVKGKKSGKSLSGFKYRDKAPPPKAFDKWAVKKLPNATRNEKGQFVSRKSLTFALSRHIYNHGIKPTLFFTKPFEKHLKRLPDELIERYKLDIEKLFSQIGKSNLKDKK